MILNFKWLKTKAGAPGTVPGDYCEPRKRRLLLLFLGSVRVGCGSFDLLPKPGHYYRGRCSATNVRIDCCNKCSRE